MNIKLNEFKRLKKLAGILKESIESGFTDFEFDDDLDVNVDNNDLFKELADSKEQEKKE